MDCVGQELIGLQTVRRDTAPSCCSFGFPHVHKKNDGLLFITHDRSTRFLNWKEALVYRLFGALPPF